MADKFDHAKYEEALALLQESGYKYILIDMHDVVNRATDMHTTAPTLEEANEMIEEVDKHLESTILHAMDIALEKFKP